MAKDLLLEIGLEEMPAHVVTKSMQQLEQKVSEFLATEKLAFSSIKSFSTPRRLAVLVSEVAEKQADTEEEVKGPAKKIALDSEGNWSKAAEGFVRGQGVTTDAITFRELKGVEYVYVTKYAKGKPAIKVLSGLKDVITSLTFPVTMHWNKYDFEYIRPSLLYIHWVVALLGEEVVPFSILDVKTGNTTRGHRFLGDDAVLENAQEYEAKLQEQFVIADPLKRKEMIVAQIDELTTKNDWQVELDEDLLEEVNNLVEYPTAFVGDFEERFLSVPEEVLVTSMKEHQRYFDVRNSAGLLLPHFISARNGNAVKLDNVVKGNEKVLTARLEDAEFFYKEDQKLTIEIVGETVGLTSEQLEDLARAAEIYKFDLVTNMVGEFPELQGIMGEKYALLQGEKPSVAQAIREHYLPISSEGELPKSDIGAVLAIADKLDSLLSFFAVGMIPSGSNDPYALRRQTYGIVRIIENRHWAFPLVELQAKINEVIGQDEKRYGLKLNSGQTEVVNFVKARLKQFLTTKNLRHDVIDAVINAEQTNLSALFSAAQILRQHLNDPDFKPSMEALTRVINEVEDANVKPELFDNDAEKALFDAVTDLENRFARQTMAENYEGLTALRPLIENYFDQTMVMVEDEKVRRNRLTQLNKIAKMALALASLDALITKNN